MLQLSSIGVPNEEQNRRALRELLFTAPGVEDHISGVVSTLSPQIIYPIADQTMATLPLLVCLVVDKLSVSACSYFHSS